MYTTDKMLKNPSLKIVGHRGAAGLAAENTAAAIRKGLESKVDEIEIDVRLTKDGIAVVHHDSDLRDSTTARHPVRHCTYADLKLLKPDLATLEEAIEATKRKVPLQIEVKSSDAVIPVVKILQVYLTRGYSESDFLLGSKNQRVLLGLHRALPSVPTVVIEPFSSIRATWRARQLGTRRISMRSWWLWGGFIRAMARRGYLLYAYTANDPDKIRKWAKYGLAGVITDNPDRF